MYFLFVFEYLCICFCVFVFLYLYLGISVCVFVFVYLCIYVLLFVYLCISLFAGWLHSLPPQSVSGNQHIHLLQVADLRNDKKELISVRSALVYS